MRSLETAKGRSICDTNQTLRETVDHRNEQLTIKILN